MTHFLVKMTEDDAHRIKSALCEMVDIATDELHKAHALMALGLISKAWRGRSATACYAEDVQAKLDAKVEASKVMMLKRGEMRSAAFHGGMNYPKGEEERIGPPACELSEPAPEPPIGYGAHRKPIDSILDMSF